MTFTKEQLIARINQVTAINKYRISQDPDADGLVMDNELFAIALAALTTPELPPEGSLSTRRTVDASYRRQGAMAGWRACLSSILGEID